MTKKTELSTTGVYSISMKGKEVSVDGYYNQISIIQSSATDHYNLAHLGFYKVGQLLVNAKKELGGDFGSLKKRLTEEYGLHEKQQERYMRIAKSKNISINYTKMPKEWTFWEQLSKLTAKQFKTIEHLISKDAKWKDLAIELKTTIVNSTTNTNYFSNQKDNRSEVFGMEYNAVVGTKKHKTQFDNFEKEMKAIAKKYPFIKLKKKNYFDEVFDILNNDIVPDDSSKKDVPKYKKQYNSSKKIDI